jgi:hypothetical protein
MTILTRNDIFIKTREEAVPEVNVITSEPWSREAETLNSFIEL